MCAQFVFLVFPTPLLPTNVSQHLFWHVALFVCFMLHEIWHITAR